MESRSFEVRFEPAGLVARVAAGTSLLAAARSVGLPVASSCGADGICGKCGMRILRGTVEGATLEEVEIKRRNRVEAEQRLSCRVRVEEDLVATATYW